MLETADIVEIQQMLNLVHHLVDLRDFDNYGRVYTDDATYDLTYRKLPLVQGLPAIIELSAKSFKRDYDHLTGHHCTNIHIYEDADGTVRAKSKVVCVMQDGSSNCADMNDIIVRTPQGWRIKLRKASTRHANPESWTKPDK